MTFLSLSDISKAYIMLICIVSFILLLIAIIAHLTQKSKGSRVALLVLCFVISVLEVSILLHLNKFDRAKYEFSLTPTFSLINEIPYFLYIATSMVFVFFAILSVYDLYKDSKNKIDSFSVKQALENLPTGIAFMTSDVELLLSNHIMHNLCRELTGKPLQNAETFWQDLISLQGKDSCVIKTNEPAFVLSNGNVWQFSKTLCRYNGNEYYEFKATDITELYSLSENTRSVNEKLVSQQKRLKKLTDIIAENVENQVAVNMKINFHDNFGNLLTLTKKALREGENTDETKTLVDYWGNLNSVIKELSSNDRQTVTLEQIMIFADKLGCEIALSGELPADEHNKTTTLLCINEMLKNAYIHAGTQKLTVDIFEANSIINVIIHNETKQRLTNIKEGGGLFGLRQRIEQTGGSMDMSCEKGVTMSVKLLKEGENYV